MKRTIVIVTSVAVTTTLTAYGFMNIVNSVEPIETPRSRVELSTYELDNPLIKKYDQDFVYNVDSRFAATITKENLDRATSLRDLVPIRGTENVISFRDVKIGIDSNYEKIAVKGSDEELNTDQLVLLRSLNYSANYYIEAFVKRKNQSTGIPEDQCFTYYVTVVPKNEASYKGGQKALIDYLSEGSREVVSNVKKDRLKSGKIYFRVTTNGTISSVRLESTSGYSKIDKTMMQLIIDMPGKWNPAVNAEGKKVGQEFVFSYGRMGC